jgi:hypothetical protein
MSILTTIKSILGFSKTTTKNGVLAEGDRYLVCMDCEEKFVFDAGEQRFFKAKGFTDPKRCPVCRKKVRSQMRKRFRSRNRAGGDRNERGGNGGGGRHHRRHSNHDSLIDGNSPYADER